MYSKHIIFGFLMGVLVMGCTSWGYRHYGLNLEEGVLMHAQDGSYPDEALETCARDEHGFKCVVVYYEEWFRLKENYLKLEEDLRACQESSR